MQNWPPKWEPGKFSPIQSRFSTLDINRLSKSDEIKEEYQKQKLKGFTVGELVNLDAFTSRMLKKGDLTNEIHWLLVIDYVLILVLCPFIQCASSLFTCLGSSIHHGCTAVKLPGQIHLRCSS